MTDRNLNHPTPQEVEEDYKCRQAQEATEDKERLYALLRSFDERLRKLEDLHAEE